MGVQDLLDRIGAAGYRLWTERTRWDDLTALRSDLPPSHPLLRELAKANYGEVADCLKNGKEAQRDDG